MLDTGRELAVRKYILKFRGQYVRICPPQSLSQKMCVPCLTKNRGEFKLSRCLNIVGRFGDLYKGVFCALAHNNWVFRGAYTRIRKY